MHDDDEGGLHDGDKEFFSDEGPEALDQDTLKKYITYARAFVKPVLHNIDSEKIASLYADLRKQSALSGGVPIAVRHIESIMRMSEASAKMHLREFVRQDDVDTAIKVVLESFLQAQKVAVRRQLQRSFRKYLIFGEDAGLLLMHQLKKLVEEQERLDLYSGRGASKETIVPISSLEKRAKDVNIYDLNPFFASQTFKKHNFSIDARNNMIVKTY